MHEDTIQGMQELVKSYQERIEELQKRYKELQDAYAHIKCTQLDYLEEKKRADEAEALVKELQAQVDHMKHPVAWAIGRVQNRNGQK